MEQGPSTDPMRLTTSKRKLHAATPDTPKSDKVWQPPQPSQHQPASRPGATIGSLAWTFAKSVLFSAVIVVLVLGMAELVTHGGDDRAAPAHH